MMSRCSAIAFSNAVLAVSKKRSSSTNDSEGRAGPLGDTRISAPPPRHSALMTTSSPRGGDDASDAISKGEQACV